MVFSPASSDDSDGEGIFKVGDFGIDGSVLRSPKLTQSFFERGFISYIAPSALIVPVSKWTATVR